MPALLVNIKSVNPSSSIDGNPLASPYRNSSLKASITGSMIGIVLIPALVFGSDTRRLSFDLPFLPFTVTIAWLTLINLFSKSTSSQRSPHNSPTRKPVHLDCCIHKSDINNTSKHYAAIEEEHKRQASQVDIYGPDQETS